MEAKDTVMDGGELESFLHRADRRLKKTRRNPDAYNAEKFVTFSSRILKELLQAQAEISFKAGIREVVEFIDSLIIGIDNCKFKERLDGDKGCIVLDMNENQWRTQLREWGE